MTIMAVVLVIFALICAVTLVMSFVNPNALADPKTGAVPGSKERVALIALGSLAFVVGVILLGSGTGDDEKAQATASALVATSDKPAPVARQIRPETIVTFPKGQIACLTEESLQSAFEDGLSGRETKMNSHFSENGECIMIGGAQRYKVIDAHYRNPEFPDSAVLEVVGEKIAAAERGFYVLMLDRTFVEIVSEPRR